MARLLLLLALLVALAACQRDAAPPPPRQIHIVGSIAAFAPSSAAAERLMRERPELVAPLVQADGTVAGIARFCAGEGPRFPDIAGATRPMTAAEQAACRAHGVGVIATLRLGRTAFVAVAAPESHPPILSRAALARALAGPARTWAEIDPALPSAPILIDGPSPPVADDLAGPLLPPGAALRRDPAYRDHGADAGLIAEAVATHPGTIGILPWPEAAARAGRLRILPLDGIVPDGWTIATGRYPATAPLLLFVKRDEVRRVPGLGLLLRYYGDAARASHL
jgi:phosphate transport system substrate-binding protein